jgi:hypothetical protein
MPKIEKQGSNFRESLMVMRRLTTGFATGLTEMMEGIGMEGMLPAVFTRNRAALVSAAAFTASLARQRIGRLVHASDGTIVQVAPKLEGHFHVAIVPAFCDQHEDFMLMFIGRKLESMISGLTVCDKRTLNPDEFRVSLLQSDHVLVVFGDSDPNSEREVHPDLVFAQEHGLSLIPVVDTGKSSLGISMLEQLAHEQVPGN